MLLIVAAGCLVDVQIALAQSGGVGTIAGNVTFDRGSVQAFRVSARDTVHRITYTVFTTRGRYQIFNLPPSTYELRVVEDGGESPARSVTVRAGGTETVDLAFTSKPSAPGAAVTLVDYDELYPPGPGRELLEGHCWGCHGPAAGWHTRGGYSEEEWRRRFARMYDQTVYDAGTRIAGIKSPPALEHDLTDAQKETIVKYLAANFPPGHPRRDWKLDPLVRDEAALGRAIYIQYELPPGGMHDVFPDPRQRGLIWIAGIGGGLIRAVDTRNLEFASRAKAWKIPQPDDGNARPHGIVEHDGRLYFAGLGCDCGGEFDPKTETFRLFPAPSPGGGGHTVRVDSRGNVWFTTVYGKSRINRADGVTGKVTEYNPVKGANWYGIVVDKQDRVWAVGYGSFFGVIMYDPKTDKWTQFHTSATNRRLTIDPRGNVWANQYFGNAIAKIVPESGEITEYKLPLKYGNPYEGWSDRDGNIWVENAVYNSLVKFDQRTERFTYVPFPQLRAHTPKMEVDSEGTLWFGLSGQLTAFKPNGNVEPRRR